MADPNSVILSGGGAKIFAHVGYLMKHWDGEGYRKEITHFSGSSAGAIVGVFAAIGCSPQRIKEILEENLINLFTPEDFKQVLNEEIKKQIHSIKPGSSGYDLSSLTKKKDYTFADLEDLAKEFPKHFKHFTAAVTVHKATDGKTDSSEMSRFHKTGSTRIFSSDRFRNLINYRRGSGHAQLDPMKCSIADVVLGSSAVPVVLPPMKIREVGSKADEKKGLTLEVYDGDFGGRRGTEASYKEAMGMGMGKQFYAHNLFAKDFNLLFARVKVAFLQWGLIAVKTPNVAGAHDIATWRKISLFMYTLYNISSRTAVKTVNYDLSKDPQNIDKVKTAKVKGLKSYNFLGALENIASTDSLMLRNLPDENIARKLLNKYQEYKKQQKEKAQEQGAVLGNLLSDEEEKEKYVLYAINKIALDMNAHKKAEAIIGKFGSHLVSGEYEEKLAEILGKDVKQLKDKQKEYYEKNTHSYNKLYEKLDEKISRLFKRIPCFKNATKKKMPGSGAEPAPAQAEAEAPAVPPVPPAVPAAAKKRKSIKVQYARAALVTILKRKQSMSALFALSYCKMAKDMSIVSAAPWAMVRFFMVGLAQNAFAWNRLNRMEKGPITLNRTLCWSQTSDPMRHVARARSYNKVVMVANAIGILASKALLVGRGGAFLAIAILSAVCTALATSLSERAEARGEANRTDSTLSRRI